jgi:hypothetical protein
LPPNESASSVNATHFHDVHLVHETEKEIQGRQERAETGDNDGAEQVDGKSDKEGEENHPAEKVFIGCDLVHYLPQRTIAPA